MRSGTRSAAVSLSPGDPVEVELNPPADAAQHRSRRIAAGKAGADRARAMRRKEDEKLPAAIGSMSSISTARSGDSRLRMRQDYPPKTVRTMPAGVARLSRSRRAGDRRSHTRNSAHESDAVFSRSAGLLSVSPGEPKVRGKIWFAGLDAAGEYRHERAISTGRAAASRPDAARAQRQLLGSREREAKHRRRACRSTIARLR